MVDSTSRAMTTSLGGSVLAALFSVLSALLGRACALVRVPVRLDRAAGDWPFGWARVVVRLGCFLRLVGCLPELRVDERLVCACARLRRAGLLPERRADEVPPEVSPRIPRRNAPAICVASFAGAKGSRAADEIARVIIGTFSFSSGRERLVTVPGSIPTKRNSLTLVRPALNRPGLPADNL